MKIYNFNLFIDNKYQNVAVNNIKNERIFDLNFNLKKEIFLCL